MKRLFCMTWIVLALLSTAQAAGPRRASAAPQRAAEQQKYFAQAIVYDKVAVSFFNRSSDGINDWLDKSIGSFFQGMSYLALTAVGTVLTYEDSAAMSFQNAAYCYQQHLLYD